MPEPPYRNVCVLRLSAIGDVCHVLAVVRALQDAWPGASFTWIIGKTEARLMGHVDDVEFVTFDKRAGFGGFLELRRRLRRGHRNGHGNGNGHFDLLLHMQLSLRASLASLLCRADLRLGYERARSRELQHWFVDRGIPASPHTHVLDVLFGFAEALGVERGEPRWDIPIPPEAQRYASELIEDGQRTLVISPCSSHQLRNWRAEHYATVADHAVSIHGLRVLLCGGPTAIERETGSRIAAAMREPVVDTIGKDSLIELLAVLQRATLLLSPDSGPVHMATAVATPVIGLYAATSSERSGPYFSRRWCVDRYAEAAQRFLGKPAAALPWGTRIERPGVMDLIRPGDVIERLDRFMADARP